MRLTCIRHYCFDNRGVALPFCQVKTGSGGNLDSAALPPPEACPAAVGVAPMAARRPPWPGGCGRGPRAASAASATARRMPRREHDADVDEPRATPIKQVRPMGEAVNCQNLTLIT